MQKNKLATVLLLVMTVALMGIIFYVGFVLSKPAEAPSTVAPVKTKAASTTYSKLIALNTSSPTETPTPTLASTLTPTSSASVSPTVTAAASRSPTPTEIILAQASPTNTGVYTGSPTQSASASATARPTSTSNLPATGYITNTLIVFGAATLLIFFSFLF